MNTFVISTKRCLIIAILIVILNIFSQTPLNFPLDNSGLAHAYNCSNENKAHQWIIRKALEFLGKSDSFTSARYHPQDYLYYLYFGAWYADHIELYCRWYAIEDWNNTGCDSMHHYASTEDIWAYDCYGDFCSPKITTANPGGFCAIDYAEVLFDQAIKFWPGGVHPNLADLPKMDAGYITSFFDGESLGDTWIGGLPFCEKYVALATDSDIISIHACPKWPSWAAMDDDSLPINERFKEAEEIVDNAMIYLAWAMHMVQDLTLDEHLKMSATREHQKFEDNVDKWIEDGSFDHLPVSTNDNYIYRPCGECSKFSYSVVPYYPYNSNVTHHWTGMDFADEAVRIASETMDGSAILPSYSEYKKTKLFIWNKSKAERFVDAAIKLTAAMIERYFFEIARTPIKPDQFEENDTYDKAKALNPGMYYEGLTCDTPRDTDWYKVRVEKDFSDIVLDIYYNKDWNLSMRLVDSKLQWLGFPRETTYGGRIERKGLKAGDYYIYLEFDMPIRYSLIVNVDIGELPPDVFEENDNPETAAKFHSGCMEGGLNIDKAGDDDYYYLEVPQGWRIIAQIAFNFNEGDLKLFMDGKEATDWHLEDDNIKKVLIKGCGVDKPVIVRVTGARNNYDMCMCRTPVLPEWKFYTGGGIFGSRFSPAIDDQRNIYLGPGDGKLYILNSDGILKRSIWTGGSVWSSPTIGLEGTIYIGSEDCNLYAFNPYLFLKWKYWTEGSVWSSPAIGPNGTVYIGSNAFRFLAFDPKDGSLKWNYWIGNSIWSSPAITSDGIVYFGSDSTYLYAFFSNGLLKWSYKTSGSVRSSPAIGSDGTIYFGSDDTSIYALNPDGTLKWSYKTSGSVRSSPAIASDGTIYIGSNDTYLYAIDPHGFLKWKFKTSGGIQSSPAIDSNGTIYFGSDDTFLYALNPDGTLKESYKTEGTVRSSPAIASDGMIYIGSDDHFFYAFKTDSIGYQEGSPWPCFQRDNFNTGCEVIARKRPCFLDADNDGYGDPSQFGISTYICPEGYVEDNTDCNDQDNTVHPGSSELCDGNDNDCDGNIDENLTRSCLSTWGPGKETCRNGEWVDCDAPRIVRLPEFKYPWSISSIGGLSGALLPGLGFSNNIGIGGFLGNITITGNLHSGFRLSSSYAGSLGITSNFLGSLGTTSSFLGTDGWPGILPSGGIGMLSGFLGNPEITNVFPSSLGMPSVFSGTLNWPSIISGNIGLFGDIPMNIGISRGIDLTSNFHGGGPLLFPLFFWDL